MRNCEQRTMAARIVTLTIFIITMIDAAMKVDRYVIRENNPIDLDCNHGLENVRRVRWEYISTYDIRSEIIYDSHFNKQLKDGFEVSCQPHQKFISTCTLKLIRARKEDSGKYVCYVQEENTALPDLEFLNSAIEIELIIRGPLHKMMVASHGDLVILPCEHNRKNITRTRWSHISLQGVLNYNLYYVNGQPTSTPNYDGDCGPHKPYCNLKILQANKESAGKYICMVGESQEFEEKYGLDQMTYFIEIQLVVGKLLCNDGLTEDQILIGENDCYGIEADVLNLKCSFNYSVNINYNLLHIRWIEKYKFNSLEKKLNSSLINHEVKDETKKISIQTSLVVALEHKNSLFQCILDDSLIKPCQLHGFKTQFVKNTTRSKSLHSNDLHNIKCSANKSENVHCWYYWVHEIGGAMVQKTNLILPVENMNSPGNYTCIAKCHLGKEKECIIKAMELEIIIEPRLSGLNIGLMVALIATLATVMVVMPIILVRMKKKNSTVKEEEETKLEIEPDKDCGSDPKSPDDSTPLTKKKTAKKSLCPFGVKQILTKITTDHDDILIYESNNPLHSKVLMLDGALWDTNYEGLSSLDFVTTKLLTCHPDPKNVLMVGRCEGRIVQKLLNCSGIESISLYDIDEAGSGHVKDLHKLYCEHFHNVVSCLKDPKVQKLGGSIDFLENYKSVFDVIVTRSSSSCKNPYKYLLSDKYFQSIREALKEGGLAVIIVSGQDVVESFVENELQYSLKKLFPVMKYFKFSNIRLSDHPSCLTKCLVCALKPEECFEERCEVAFHFITPKTNDSKNGNTKLSRKQDETSSNNVLTCDSPPTPGSNKKENPELSRIKVGNEQDNEHDSDPENSELVPLIKNNNNRNSELSSVSQHPPASPSDKKITELKQDETSSNNVLPCDSPPTPDSNNNRNPKLSRNDVGTKSHKPCDSPPSTPDSALPSQANCGTFKNDNSKGNPELSSVSQHPPASPSDKKITKLKENSIKLGISSPRDSPPLTSGSTPSNQPNK